MGTPPDFWGISRLRVCIYVKLCERERLGDRKKVLFALIFLLGKFQILKIKLSYGFRKMCVCVLCVLKWWWLVWFFPYFCGFFCVFMGVWCLDIRFCFWYIFLNEIVCTLRWETTSKYSFLFRFSCVSEHILFWLRHFLQEIFLLRVVWKWHQKSFSKWQTHKIETTLHLMAIFDRE